MKIYSFWDIPHTMLEAVKAVIAKDTEATIFLTNASEIREEIDKLIVDNKKVKVIYIERWK